MRAHLPKPKVISNRVQSYSVLLNVILTSRNNTYSVLATFVLASMTAPLATYSSHAYSVLSTFYCNIRVHYEFNGNIFRTVVVRAQLVISD